MLGQLPDFHDPLVAKTLLSTQKSIDFFPVTFVDYNYNYAYHIIVYGNLINGTPACILIKNPFCPIYVLMSDEEKDKEEIEKLINNHEKKIYYESKVVYKKPLRGFFPHDLPFLEISCRNTINRCQVINLLSKESDYCIFDNEKTQLYKLVWARQGLYSAGWLTLKNPRLLRDSGIYNGIVVEVDINDISNTPDNKQNDLYHQRCKIRKVAWDIETETTGVFSPKVVFTNFDTDKIASIAMSIVWADQTKLVDIVLTTKVSAPTDDFIIIRCANEKQLILCFFKVLAKYHVNAIIGFNDYKYDWPMVIHRIKHYFLGPKIDKLMKILTIDMFGIKFGIDDNVKIKIPNHEDWTGYCYQHLSGVCIDMLPLLKKEFDYGGGEKANINSLNDFLADNGLDPKDDLSYVEINRIFNHGTPEETLKVLVYNLRDCTAVHDLDKKRGMINAVQETCNFTYSSFYTGIFLAVGVKITNAVRNEAYKHNKLLCKDNESYPNLTMFGALVLDRNLGLHAYNVFDYEKYSPALQEEISLKDWSFRTMSIKKNIEYIEEIHSPKIRQDLYEWLERFPPRKASEPWVADRPSAPRDFRSLYPSDELQNNMSPDTKVSTLEEYNCLINGDFGYTEDDFEEHTFAGETSWLFKHNGDPKRMGVIVLMLHRLFKFRMSVKAKIKEGTDAFTKNLLTTREKAVKLILNSTYGQYGDQHNHYFRDNFIFQGTCNFARKALLMAKIWAEHKGSTINYGDTDSVYATAPEEIFKALDLKYKNEEISLWEYQKEMVDLTIDWSIKSINDFNKAIGEKEPFLEMAFEPVLYHLLMIAAKHYTGLECKAGLPDVSNMDLVSFGEILLQKGVVTKKRDRSIFIKQCFMMLQKRIQDIYINKTLGELCQEQVSELLKNNYDRDLFKAKSVFKAKATGNKKNMVFAQRMKELYDYQLDNLEKFEYYVVIRPDNNYTLDAKRIVRLGERMWLCSKADEENLKLDMEYYASAYIKAICNVLSYKYPNKVDSKNFLASVMPKGVKAILVTNAHKRIYKKYHDSAFDFCGIYNNLRNITHDQFLSTLLQKVYDEVKLSVFNQKIVFECVGETFKIMNIDGYYSPLKFVVYQPDFKQDMLNRISDLREEHGPYKIKEIILATKVESQNYFSLGLRRLSIKSQSCHPIFLKYHQYLMTNIFNERKAYYEDIEETEPIKKNISSKDYKCMKRLEDILEELVRALYDYVLYHIALSFI